MLRGRATPFEPYLEDPRQRDEHEPKDVTRLFVEKLHLDAPPPRRKSRAASPLFYQLCIYTGLYGHSHKGRAALADPGVRNGNGHRRDPGLIARAARVDPKQRTGKFPVTSHVRA